MMWCSICVVESIYNLQNAFCNLTHPHLNVEVFHHLFYEVDVILFATPSWSTANSRWYVVLTTHLHQHAKACWWLTWCFDRWSENILMHSWYFISILTMSLIIFPVFSFNFSFSNREWPPFKFFCILPPTRNDLRSIHTLRRNTKYKSR